MGNALQSVAEAIHTAECAMAIVEYGAVALSTPCWDHWREGLPWVSSDGFVFDSLDNAACAIALHSSGIPHVTRLQRARAGRGAAGVEEIELRTERCGPGTGAVFCLAVEPAAPRPRVAESVLRLSTLFNSLRQIARALEEHPSTAPSVSVALDAVVREACAELERLRSTT